MAVTAAEYALLLEPKLSNFWHDSFRAVPSKFGKVFNVMSMNKNTITHAKMAGFGPLQLIPDGDSIMYDDPIAPITTTYTYIVKGLGYRIHERIWINDLYGETRKLESDLRDAANDDVETAAWSVFNNGFTTTNTGFDSLALFSTAHTRMDGGATWQNRPSTDEALSLSGVQNAIITMRKWKNDRGRPRVHTPKQLIVPVDLEFTAKEILRSTQVPESANNAINAVREYNLSLLEVEHLTSTTGWFVQADKHDLNFFWRYRAKTGMETDFDTNTIKRKVWQAYAYGFGEARGVYGTTGS